MIFADETTNIPRRFRRLLMLVPETSGDDACRYIKSRTGLVGYEIGGPYS
jgi:hypothetical protein